MLTILFAYLEVYCSSRHHVNIIRSHQSSPVAPPALVQIFHRGQPWCAKMVNWSVHGTDMKSTQVRSCLHHSRLRFGLVLSSVPCLTWAKSSQNLGFLLFCPLKKSLSNLKLSHVRTRMLTHRYGYTCVLHNF